MSTSSSRCTTRRRCSTSSTGSSGPRCRTQCGFKALREDAAGRLVPRVADDGWFFDTELLLLAQRNGIRIHEVPVGWVEDLDSRVDLRPTIHDDLRGLWRMRRSFWRGEGRYPWEPADRAVAA